jgi:outer membrane protein TolC
MKAVIAISCSLAVAGGMSAVWAAEAPLTLEAAVQAALAAAPQLQSQRAAVEGAAAALIGAGRLPDPELVTGVDNLPSNGVDAWSFGRDFMTMRKIGLMQSFPSRSKRHAEQASAQAQVVVAQSGVSEIELKLSQLVSQAWVVRFAAESSLQQLQELRPQSALLVELARAAVASGRATVGDALSAQAALAELDDRVLDAQREVLASKAALERWIEKSIDRKLAAAPSFAELHASDAALLAALHHHAALLSYDAKIAAARSEVAVANAAKRSDWSTELDYAKRGPGFSNMVSLQIRVALPLFSATRQDPAIHARRAAVSQLEADRAAELRMHTAEINTMLAEWQSARERVALYEHERLPLARERSELALAGLRAGRLEARASLTVLNEEIEVRRSYAELLKMLGTSWAYLRYLPTEGVAP